jgi:hypothetical protein
MMMRMIIAGPDRASVPRSERPGGRRVQVHPAGDAGACRDGAQALITEVEHLVKDSRANGVDEGVIWQKIKRPVSRS